MAPWQWFVLALMAWIIFLLVLDAAIKVRDRKRREQRNNQFYRNMQEEHLRSQRARNFKKADDYYHGL